MEGLGLGFTDISRKAAIHFHVLCIRHMGLENLNQPKTSTAGNRVVEQQSQITDN